MWFKIIDKGSVSVDVFNLIPEAPDQGRRAKIFRDRRS
jgi:hypothetical protein